MTKESTKKSKKWKPKRKWVESVIIDTKTGKRKYQYCNPKTPEEEKEWQEEYDEKMRETIESVLFRNK